MKLVSYNVQFGMGLDGRYDPARIASNLDGADVIALQEVTRGFFRNGHADMVADLEPHFPFYYKRFAASCDVLLEAGFSADGRAVERRFQFGNMVLSRHPILAARTLLLPRGRTVERMNMQRSALEAVIATPSGPLRVYSLHLDHVSADERLAQIAFLNDRIRQFPLEGGALTGAHEYGMTDPPLPEDYVVLGDFNMLPESIEYDAMAGRATPGFGRPLRHDRPVDALARFGGLTPETHSWLLPTDEGPITALFDYAFLHCNLVPRMKNVFIDTQAEGSDHFPLWLELE
ncbi:MAG: endonuclease [Shinella sp.]|nr:MAG: endonuclease [Shinella sp.]